MLVHTLWRKMLSSECERANDELNDQIYKLLCANRWQLSAELGKFSLSQAMLNGATDMQHRIRLINTAIALKNLKKASEMQTLLAQLDWSASIRDFRLATSILTDQTDSAISIMKQIGKRGELVHEVAYHQWPLFDVFRKTPEFHKTYEEIYGYPFYFKMEKSAEDARTKLEQVKDQKTDRETETVGTNSIGLEAKSTGKGFARRRKVPPNQRES